MIWNVEYLPEAVRDFDDLDGSQQILVRKAIKKTGTNPLPLTEGGYGKPLGNKGSRNLTGFFKVKLKNADLRIVYKLIKQNEKIIIVVIGIRADEEVYDIAAKRIEKHNL